MLSHDENELLTKTGPGTAMGALIRRYWIPVVQSRELEPGGRVKRVMLLGERLVAFRGTERPARAHRRVLSAPAAPRSTSAGSRKRACAASITAGSSASTASAWRCRASRAESGFASKVEHTAYPCAERGGIIWAYMGPASPPPPLPDLEFDAAARRRTSSSPSASRTATGSRRWRAASTRATSRSSTRRSITATREVTRGIDRASFGVGAAVETGDRAPRFEVADTEYGVAHRRAAHPARRALVLAHHRSSCCPSTRCRPPTSDEKIVQSHIWVPMDDTHLVNWMVTWHPERALTDEEIALNVQGKGAHVCDYSPATSEPYGDIRTAANRDNDYWMDWEAHRTRMFCGIPGFGVQDQAIQESQGPSSTARASDWARATPPSSRCAGAS